jgi:hypothetical protein
MYIYLQTIAVAMSQETARELKWELLAKAKDCIRRIDE